MLNLSFAVCLVAVNRVSTKGWNWNDHTQSPKWLTTQSSESTPSSTRVTITMSTTDAETDYETCFSTCLVTRELRPVCGSNGVTYTNKRQLNCAKTCGLGNFNKMEILALGLSKSREAKNE